MAARKKTQKDEVVIPDRLYFRIGEVSRLCRLPTYVLRFWETEFPQLRPVKGGTGQRMYRRRDVELVVRIRKLLYDQGFTIAGARQRLKEFTRAEPLPFAATRADELGRIRDGLKEILAILKVSGHSPRAMKPARVKSTRRSRLSAAGS